MDRRRFLGTLAFGAAAFGQERRGEAQQASPEQQRPSLETTLEHQKQADAQVGEIEKKSNEVKPKIEQGQKALGGIKEKTQPILVEASAIKIPESISTDVEQATAELQKVLKQAEEVQKKLVQPLDDINKVNVEVSGEYRKLFTQFIELRNNFQAVLDFVNSDEYKNLLAKSDRKQEMEGLKTWAQNFGSRLQKANEAFQSTRQANEKFNGQMEKDSMEIMTISAKIGQLAAEILTKAAGLRKKAQ